MSKRRGSFADLQRFSAMSLQDENSIANNISKAPEPRKTAKSSKMEKESTGIWPNDALYFKTFPSEDAYTLLYEILLERGWKFAGKPYNGEDFKALEKVVKRPQPKRCLWLVDEHEAHILSKLPKDEAPGGRHRIFCFLGSEAANYKTNLTLKLNDMDFYPSSFAMPKENERFERESKTGKEGPLWIYKPKNDYGGAGCYVYDARTPEFKQKVKTDVERRRNFVLQRYIENPLLLGGYKFHMRIFLYLKSMDPLEGYIYKGGQVLFSTKKYTSDTSTMGENFDNYAHLTNWSLHGQPANHERLLENKDVVGVGCEWRYAKLIRHLKSNYSKYCETNMLKQLERIGKEVLVAIASHSTCKKYAKKMIKDRHFEVFGMDILMDENFKCWLLECNNSPGLNDSPEKVPVPAKNGTGTKTRINKGAREAGKDTREFIHDICAILNLDSYTKIGSKKNFTRIL